MYQNVMTNVRKHTHNIQFEFISFDCKINWESQKRKLSLMIAQHNLFMIYIHRLVPKESKYVLFGKRYCKKVYSAINIRL